MDPAGGRLRLWVSGIGAVTDVFAGSRAASFPDLWRLSIGACISHAHAPSLRDTPKIVQPDMQPWGVTSLYERPMVRDAAGLDHWLHPAPILLPVGVR
jgi:hypothetical protein